MKLFAHLVGNEFNSFHCSLIGIEAGYGCTDNIWEVEVSESKTDNKEDIKYWAWLDFKENEFSFIFPSEIQTKMCSPDFFAGAIERGEGRITKVDIKPIKKIK